MSEKDSKSSAGSRPRSECDTGRRRVITGIGAVAAASWLPSSLRAQSVREAEIIIIGGGMAGSSTAFQLASLGRDVTLLERNTIASEASGQNMGGLGGAGWGNTPNLLSYLTMGSLEIFRQLQIDMGYDMEFRQTGSLVAIQTEEQFEYIKEQVFAGRSAGYEHELLTTREARAIEPEVNPELLGAMFLPGRGQADPVKSTQAFADAAARAGASIDTGQNVTSIRIQGNGEYRIQTDNAEYRCQTLVLAAGSWCGPVGRMLGLEIPIKPIRGQMWATENTASPRFSYLVVCRIVAGME